MVERILFLTGALAEKRLKKVLEAMAPTDFTYQTHQVGVKVAALMTATMRAALVRSLSSTPFLPRRAIECVRWLTGCRAT